MDKGNPIVRKNLLEREGYSPYCGSDSCTGRWPRTIFTGEQFRCPVCEWVSRFPSDFITEYKYTWGIN
jgi:hypothetical protein